MSESDASEKPGGDREVQGLPVLTEEEAIRLENSQVANALSKIQRGQSLTRREQELIDAARRRGMKAEAPPAEEILAPDPPTPPEGFALAVDAVLSKADIATLYSVDGVPLSVKTIERANAAGRLPDVAEPPPWEDPAALAEWYRLHYRSDLTKPTRTNAKRTLPRWLIEAVARQQSTAAPASRAPSPAPALPPPSRAPAAPDPASSPASQVPVPPLPDALATAEQMLARIHQRYLTVKDDAGLAPAAERAYLEALEKVQLAQDRARKSGDAESQMRLMVEECIDRIHRRIPEHLTAELASVRREVALASATPEGFAVWASQFFAAVGVRLARVRFNPADAAPAA